MQTDLPEPVAPAISIWGILPMSATTTLPAMSLPTANAILLGNSLNSFDSNKSRNATGVFSLFGTSIPIAALPGMGASIRISVAARFNLISSASPTILLTLTPCSGCSSYRVTEGPWLMFVIVTLTPNVCSVCCSLAAVSFNSLAESPPPPFPFCKQDKGGNMYFFGTLEGVVLLCGMPSGLGVSVVFFSGTTALGRENCVLSAGSGSAL